MIRALIVDDEALNRDELRYLLGAHPDIAVVGEAASFAAALTLAASQRPDLVLLDINMETDDAGMRLAAQIARLPQPPALVFVTAHAEWALPAYDFQPAHFLLKPVEAAALAIALARVRAQMNPDLRQPPDAAASPLKLSVKYRDSQGGENGFALAYPRAESILFIRKNKVDNTAEIALVGGELLPGVRQTLETFETQLAGANFFRIHASFLVNLDHARALRPRPGDDENMHLWLTGFTGALPVSKLRLGALKGRLAG